jgi:hypothetical protein
MIPEPSSKPAAAALFRDLVAQDHRDALTEDRARVERGQEKMARLKAQRLAAGEMVKSWRSSSNIPKLAVGGKLVNDLLGMGAM